MVKKGSVLIVDDNLDILEALRFLLEDEFSYVFTLNDPKKIPQVLDDYTIDIVILDMNFSAGVSSGKEGLEWLRYFQKFDKDIIVIIITAYAEIELAVKAVREGAFDFIPKPWDNEKLLSTLSAAMRFRKTNLKLSSAQNQKEHYKNELEKDLVQLVCESPAMKKIMTLLEKAAPTEANIFITGENGTGKSLLARYIHNHSPRYENAFINVDLGALHENLFESELFGYNKGAFTDAKIDHPGRFEIVNGGTIFLDEITNLPANLQPKLLSVLQNKKVVRLGSNKEIDLDFRLISATNKDVQQLVSTNQFREDLFYRLNTIMIDLPPLRERKEDVEALSQLLLEKYSRKYQKEIRKFSGNALSALIKYSWPGNIRELDHTIEKAVILTNNKIIDTADLVLKSAIVDPTKNVAIKTLEEIEKHAIISALGNHSWNISEAAKELNISRQSIYNKMRKYDL